MKTTFIARIVGLILLILSLFFVVYSVRAGISQLIYYRAKNGYSDTGDLYKIYRQTNHLYPYNYRFFAWSAEEAFNRGSKATDEKSRDKNFELAELLCDKGLALNKYERPLPFIKTQLLYRKSPTDAVVYWEKYVEWDYWNSYNHAVLASLYAGIGKFGQAMQTLQFIKGTPDYNSAEKIVMQYWDKAMSEPPPVPPAAK